MVNRILPLFVCSLPPVSKKRVKGSPGPLLQLTFLIERVLPEPRDSYLPLVSVIDRSGTLENTTSRHRSLGSISLATIRHGESVTEIYTAPKSLRFRVEETAMRCPLTFRTSAELPASCLVAKPRFCSAKGRVRARRFADFVPEWVTIMAQCAVCFWTSPTASRPAIGCAGSRFPFSR
jgi:hypothetical protein